jgi:hypothetical protein
MFASVLGLFKGSLVVEVDLFTQRAASAKLSANAFSVG